MKAGKLYTKKTYKVYSITFLILGIICIIIGIPAIFALFPLGLLILLLSFGLIKLSKYYKKCSIKGGIPEEIEHFTSTLEIPGVIKFNDNKKQLVISPNFNPVLLDYSNILDFELLENENTIVTKSGLGRAVAGGLLFGSVGAVVGGVTGKRKSTTNISSLKIKLTLNNTTNPVVYIILLKTNTKTSSFVYKVAYDNAQKILSVLQIITNDNNKTHVIKEKSSSFISDELIKLNELAVKGILSEEEFNIQKAKLLNN